MTHSIVRVIHASWDNGQLDSVRRYLAVTALDRGTLHRASGGSVCLAQRKGLRQEKASVSRLDGPVRDGAKSNV